MRRGLCCSITLQPKCLAELLSELQGNRIGETHYFDYNAEDH